MFRIRWSTPADLPALTEVFARASLSHDGDRDALLAHPEALVLEGDGIAEGLTRVATNTDDIVGFANDALGFVADGEIETPFGPGQRMHLAVAPERS